MAWGAAKLSRQKNLDQFPGKRGPDHFSTETTDIHVVIFDALMGREDMLNEPGTYAVNLVCGNGRSHPAAAEPPLHVQHPPPATALARGTMISG